MLRDSKSWRLQLTSAVNRWRRIFDRFGRNGRKSRLASDFLSFPIESELPVTRCRHEHGRQFRNDGSSEGTAIAHFFRRSVVVDPPTIYDVR